MLLVNSWTWQNAKKTSPLNFIYFFLEISAAATIINWWKPVLPDPVWSTIFILLVLTINLVGVRLYGELEYWFALLKILIVLVFIIIGKNTFSSLLEPT